MDDLARRELTVSLRMSLPVWLPIILASAIAVVMSVLGGLHGVRIVLGVVGLVGLVLAGVAVARPPALVLDADGLSLRTVLGRRWAQRWADCGEFRTWRRDVVVWVNSTELATHPRRVRSWRRRAGADAGLVAQFGGLDAAALAALLNRYRTAARRAARRR